MGFPTGPPTGPGPVFADPVSDLLDREVTSQLSLLEVSVVIALLVVTLILAWWIPNVIKNRFKALRSQSIRRSIKKEARKRELSPEQARTLLEGALQREGARIDIRLEPLEKAVRYGILLLLGFYTLWVADVLSDHSILGGGTASAVLFFLVEMVTIVLLLQYGVRTIADMAVQIFVRSDTSVRYRRRVASDLSSSITWFLVLLLAIISLAFIVEMIGERTLGEVAPFMIVYEDVVLAEHLERIILFVFIIGLTIIVSGIVLLLLRASVLHPSRMDAHVARPFERILTYAFIIVGLAMAVTVLSPELPDWGIVLLITVVGFVLGFGLQFQIANIIAGLTIAIDKPYSLGDRIRVGREAMGMETWGDVEDITLQSTRIVTTENELVTIPNYLLATNPVWNFTRGDKKQAINLPVGISYGSDWRLAQGIILEKVKEHPKVLTDPPPFVRLDAFGESSINFVVWAWIQDARDLLQVKSDLLGAIKDGFDEGGVEIPFPYRTLVNKKDIPPEKRLTPEEKKEHEELRKYWKGYETFSYAARERVQRPLGMVSQDKTRIRRILVPTSGTTTAGMLAEYSMTMAGKINASVTALYVLEGRSKTLEEDGMKALEIFTKVGRAHGVSTTSRMKKGAVLQSILLAIEETGADMVIMGSGKSGVLPARWGREDLASEVLKNAKVPVVVMPFRPELMDS